MGGTHSKGGENREPSPGRTHTRGGHAPHPQLQLREHRASSPAGCLTDTAARRLRRGLPGTGRRHHCEPRTPTLPLTNLCPPPRDRPPQPQPPPPRAHAAAAATVAACSTAPPAGLGCPILTPPQRPPVYNDWDGTGRAGPERKRIPSSRRSRLPRSSTLHRRLTFIRANAGALTRGTLGGVVLGNPAPNLQEGCPSRKHTTTSRKSRASCGPEVS